MADAADADAAAAAAADDDEDADADDDDDDLVRDVVHVPRLVALKCYGAYLMLRLL